MKKIMFSLLAFSFILHAKGQDVLTGLESPAYGVRIKANFPYGNSGWSRGFYIVNQNNTSNFFGLGVMGGINNGVSSMSYGWIGQDYNNSFMSFLPDGKIGIGKNNPEVSLDVNGQVIIKGEGNTLLLKKTNNIPALAFQGATGVSVIESGDDYMKAYVGGNTRLTILANGNIGIGTSSPSAKLAVNGNIRAQEIKVETANWPDYVFNKDYKILGLPELDAYIKANKHLPGMPSAKEVEANGIALGEMIKKLLKNQEELTLHIIEQNEKIELLKNKLIKEKH